MQARHVWFAMPVLGPHLSIFEQLAVFVTVTGAAGARWLLPLNSWQVCLGPLSTPHPQLGLKVEPW